MNARSQQHRLYVVVGPDLQSAKWSHHNQRETSETTPHLKPIHPSHLTFSLQLHRVSPKSARLKPFQWINGHLITFWMFIVPLLQHLLHLLIPVTHLTSVKCLKMSEQNWSISKWSTHIILISPFTPPHLISSHPWSGSHLPPPLINNNARKCVHAQKNLPQSGIRVWLK